MVQFVSQRSSDPVPASFGYAAIVMGHTLNAIRRHAYCRLGDPNDASLLGAFRHLCGPVLVHDVKTPHRNPKQ
jgi:hypothetical protein